MLIHRVFAAFRRILPDRVSTAVRAVGTAFFRQLNFAYDTGHFRSSLRSKAFDKHGRPIPWYTYPAIQVLRAKSFAGKRVLEFGAGQSTIWWAHQAESVISLEDNPEWYRYIVPQLPGNASVHLAHVRLAEFEKLVPSEMKFDVIIVDGLDRAIAARKSLSRLTEDGVLIRGRCFLFEVDDHPISLGTLNRYGDGA